MNKELETIIKKYSMESHKKLNNYLIEKSKDSLIAALMDLLTMYINDKNSSTLREFLTVVVAGYKHRESKIGYNGFKQSVFAPGRTLQCEAKPKNINTNDKKIKKLNGGGNFTDYTFGRLKKDKKEKGLNMLISGFIDGKLIYIIEFPFNSAVFVQHLKRQLLKRFKEGGDKKGEFLRSASFHYQHFIEIKKLKIAYLVDKKELEKHSKYIVKPFFVFLMKKYAK
ncbi:MAG: hypothetical protein KKD35_05445 [Elusimicrobia bacterium]|nr:hypothetical protein [Elusimicrobiota bacterium]